DPGRGEVESEVPQAKGRDQRRPDWRLPQVRQQRCRKRVLPGQSLTEGPLGQCDERVTCRVNRHLPGQVCTGPRTGGRGTLPGRPGPPTGVCSGWWPGTESCRREA